MDITPIIILLAGVCNLLLGIFVLLKEKSRNRLTTFFTIFCLVYSAWIFSNFFLIVAPSVFWLKSTYAFGAIAVCSAIFFVREICGKKINKIFYSFILALGSFFLLFWYFGVYIPPLTSEQVAKAYATGTEVINNQTFYTFYVFYLSSALLYVVLTLILSYVKIKDTVQKNQIGYVMLGLSLGSLGIVSGAFILPSLGVYEYSYIIDSPSSIFVIFFSALAITKFHLFDLKVILTEILVVAMAVVLFLLPFSAADLQMQITTAVIFVAFCFCGYLLIKNAHKEAHQKEVLEQTVKERTKELEQAKNLAETRANDLQKTSGELKERNDELERFYKLTVGRELRMIELKEKIKKLQNV